MKETSSPNPEPMIANKETYAEATQLAYDVWSFFRNEYPEEIAQSTLGTMASIGTIARLVHLHFPVTIVGNGNTSIGESIPKERYALSEYLRGRRFLLDQYPDHQLPSAVATADPYLSPFDRLAVGLCQFERQHVILREEMCNRSPVHRMLQRFGSIPQHDRNEPPITDSIASFDRYLVPPSERVAIQRHFDLITISNQFRDCKTTATILAIVLNFAIEPAYLAKPITFIQIASKPHPFVAISLVGQSPVLIDYPAQVGQPRINHYSTTHLYAMYVSAGCSRVSEHSVSAQGLRELDQTYQRFLQLS